MAVIGARPVAGVRIDVERPHDGGPPWIYEGSIATSERDFEVRATVDAAGEVAVTSDAPADVVEKVRLIVRTAARNAMKEEVKEEACAPPPRRIQRWRGEK